MLHGTGEIIHRAGEMCNMEQVGWYTEEVRYTIWHRPDDTRNRWDDAHNRWDMLHGTGEVCKMEQVRWFTEEVRYAKWHRPDDTRNRWDDAHNRWDVTQNRWDIQRGTGHYSTPPKGGWGMSEVSPLSWISGLSFGSTLLSTLLFFCQILLLFLSYLSSAWWYILKFFPENSSIYVVKR